MANFDDLDPLSQEPSVRLTMLKAGQALPGDTDIVIIPGTKSTRGDLAYLKEQGWDIDIAAHVRRGGHVLGLCGGYQMLGKSIADPNGLEGASGSDPGLGLLDIDTVMHPNKQVTQTDAIHSASGQEISGYEIHLGHTEGPDCARPFSQIGARHDGALSSDGRIVGTYLHGMFRGDGFRRAWLAGFGAEQHASYTASVEVALDQLADHLTQHARVDEIIP